MRSYRPFFLILIFLLSSCVSNIQNYGCDQQLTSFHKLKVGKSTKADVISIVGSPSTVSAFNSDEWYYVTITTKKISFFKADVIGHLVTKLQFKRGVLAKITSYSSNETQSLDFNPKESPVTGHDSSAIKDAFYNMGRFNKALNKRA